MNKKMDKVSIKDKGPLKFKLKEALSKMSKMIETSCIV